MKQYRVRIMRRLDDSVKSETFCDTMEEVDEVVDDFFYTCGELNLRNVKYYYSLSELAADGETYRDVKRGDKIWLVRKYSRTN